LRTQFTSMRLHFIAIGGSAMHNLAIALHKKGYKITGSDDEIFEPSRSRLGKYGLLPGKDGWDEENITPDLDAVILGMHARSDNPELNKAKESGIKIYSYPEYIYEQSKNKLRVVIGGSHGKTTITAMIMHVLRDSNLNFDYMVGAQLEGFDTMVKITDEASIIILEGDEYLSSPIDRRPKFHLYKPDIALISGIAWDHINVFPTYEEYVEQFRIFANMVPDGGSLIYCSDDAEVRKICDKVNKAVYKFPYHLPEYTIEDGVTYLIDNSDEGQVKHPLQIFGEHNLQNLEGAREVCNRLSITGWKFYNSIKKFSGAARRLELLGKNERTVIYKDFAHSPSKLKATTHAVKNQYPERQLIACMELHTFSSLNENFLQEYKNSMQDADSAFVYFNPHTIEHKKLKPVTPRQVKKAFGKGNITIFTDVNSMLEELKKADWNNKVLLMMSSGNFDGLNLNEFSKVILEKGELV
jgi:UDP-N-acetylmuramate: L-alanyl-gamma-D-glutamyl-meso-diaminopimelate ligase